MSRFSRAREELYGQLYDKFLAEDGPYFGKSELDGLRETNSLINRAELYAKDMKHIVINRFGGVRLSASGIDYYEQEILGE